MQAPAPAPAPEMYKVKIHRPFMKGQELSVDVEAHQLAKALVQGHEEQVVGLTEELNIHLVGDVTIDEIDADGRAAVATLKVTSFVNPENQTAYLPAGAVVHGKRVEGMLVAELEGGKLSDDQQRLLNLAFPFERPGSRLGDELFGTPDPHAVGDSWPFNRGYVAQDLREQDGIAATETGIDGMVKLQEIVPCGKTQCLRLAIDMTATTASMVSVEGASDVGSGELRSTILLEVPVDETTPVHLEDATTTLTFAATFKQGDQEIQRQIAASRLRRAQYVPKK